jgi:hypothetical protein
MQISTQSIPAQVPAEVESTTIETTLYELIEAIGAEVEPGEDDLLIIATMVHLLNSGQVKFTGDWKNARIVCK